MKMKTQIINWKEIKRLMHEKYLFNSAEHDLIVYSCKEWETSYFTQYPEVETHLDGRPRFLELQGMENDLLFYIQTGWWGDALLTMEKIDAFCQK